MANIARITKYTRKSTETPHWLTPKQFGDLKAGTLDLGPTYSGPVAVEFVNAWRANADRIDPFAFAQSFFTLRSGETLFTIQIFETVEKLNELMSFIEVLPEQVRLVSAREGCAQLFNVSVTLYQPVSIDFEAYPTLSGAIVETLIAPMTGVILVS